MSKIVFGFDKIKEDGDPMIIVSIMISMVGRFVILRKLF